MTRPPIHRRSFLTFLGASAAAWPLAARAQAMPVIGYIHLGSPTEGNNNLAGFHKGLNESGFVEGRNVTIEYRWAHFERSRLRDLAADLVRRRVNLIASPGGGSAALAAQAVTRTIPIVFAVAGDPVRLGLVASLNRPGGNATGAASMSQDITSKRIGLLHELLPNAARLGMLAHPTSPNIDFQVREAQAASAAIGRDIEVLYASTNREIDAAFASLAQKKIEGLVVTSDTFLDSRRVQIVTLAVRYSMPTIMANRAGAEAGGLMSYAAQPGEADRQTGLYAGRILKGENPPTCRSSARPNLNSSSTCKPPARSESRSRRCSPRAPTR